VLWAVLVTLQIKVQRIFTKHISDKGLVTKYRTLKFRNKKINNQFFKMGKRFEQSLHQRHMNGKLTLENMLTIINHYRNKDKTIMRYYYMPITMLKFKRSLILCCMDEKS
jgi:hypothetical protein